MDIPVFLKLPFIFCRRADREPNLNSWVCSCHFKEKKNENDPTIFKRNVDKFFPVENAAKKRKLRVISTSEACLVPKIDDDKLNNFSFHLAESALMDSWTIYLESVDKYKTSDVATYTSNRFLFI